MTTSLARRQEVLKLARKYNFLILEDDPYYHLYFGSAAPPASYFSLERRMGGDIGRVLRFDSLSKILAAGFRLGWITGPDYLVAQIERHVSFHVFASHLSPNVNTRVPHRQCSRRLYHK